MDPADLLSAAGIVKFAAFLLALHAPEAAKVVRALAACDAESGGLESCVSLALASGVALLDVCRCNLWVLQISGAVCFKVAAAQKLAVVILGGLLAAEAVAKLR